MQYSELLDKIGDLGRAAGAVCLTSHVVWESQVVASVLSGDSLYIPDDAKHLETVQPLVPELAPLTSLCLLNFS